MQQRRVVTLPPDSLTYVDQETQARVVVADILGNRSIKYISVDCEWPVRPGTYEMDGSRSICR